MARLAVVYVTVFAALLVIDLVWLGLVARGFYKRHLGHLMRDAPNWGAAVLFYVFYTAGIVVLAVRPALDGGWPIAAGLGAALGLCAYGAYNLTNLATLRDWPWRLSVVDMAWGTALTAATAVAGFAVS
ncbi:MAG TPA: DUF2177 family protein [Vineibacter sp.]|nr:DUF2177 family protein [Vineibacter sp.]